MSYAERHTIEVATNAGGAATEYSEPLKGELINIIYEKTDFANGVDFTITGETTGLGLWTEENVDADKTVSPRQPLHDQEGNALLYAAAGEPVSGPIYLAGERVKIVIANGGNVKSGTFHVIIAGTGG